MWFSCVIDTETKLGSPQKIVRNHFVNVLLTHDVESFIFTIEGVLEAVDMCKPSISVQPDLTPGQQFSACSLGTPGSS